MTVRVLSGQRAGAGRCSQDSIFSAIEQTVPGNIEQLIVRVSCPLAYWLSSCAWHAVTAVGVGDSVAPPATVADDVIVFGATVAVDKVYVVHGTSPPVG